MECFLKNSCFHIFVVLGYFSYISQCQDICEAGEYLVDNNCRNCPRGSYMNSTDHQLQACTPCPRNNATGRNATTLIPGSTQASHCFYEPTIESFHPTYGPVSGGTEIEVQLYTFEEWYDVRFANVARKDALINGFNKSAATVLIETAMVEARQDGYVELTFTIDRFFTSEHKYFYVEDPVIHEVDRLKTFISGGLPMGISGENLRAIQHPRFFISMSYRGRIATAYGDCTVDPGDESGSNMTCYTPDLGPMLRENSIAYGRRKRTTEPHTLNDADKQFYGGFELDGVTEYRNLSVTFPDQGEFLVYLDPVYFPFTEENLVKYFNTEDRFLNIEGERLNFATDEDDVTVSIGKGYCNVTHLASNMLTCIPPQTQPEVEDTGYGPGLTPRVMVTVGKLDFVIGFLSYSPLSEEAKEDEPDEIMLGIIGGSAGIALLLIIIIIILVMLVRRKRHKKLSRAQIEERLGSRHGMRSHQERYVSNNNNNPPTNIVYAEVDGDGSFNNDGYEIEAGQRPRGRMMSETINPPPQSPDGQMRSPDFYMSMKSDEAPGDILEELEENLRLSVKECLIPCDHITVEDVIGTGYFGKVFKGILMRKEKEETIEEVVAVKAIQGTLHTVKEIGAFLEEAIIMREFEHTNVLSLIGIAMKGAQPLVILPFMANGDLKTYIREPSRSIKVKELLGYGQQIARGMAYLSKHKFVHRDLATRNCMLSDTLVVKIADFGLSRDVYKSDYYRVEDRHRPLPVRWMAVESLTNGVFSAKSDVWSFGVCLWELLTRGCSPYPDVDTFNIKQYVCSGRRLSQPDHTPDDVYEMLQSCWFENPEDRPDFTELYDVIENILDTGHTDYTKIILAAYDLQNTHV